MAELSFSKDELIVSKTDTKGKITYGNDIFYKLSGYTEKELIGSPHNIIRHPDMPKVIFKLLWVYLQSGREIHAYVVNRAKNGDYYWVFANVTPSYDESGRVIGYYSVRRAPEKEALDIIKPLYKKLVKIENSSGVAASEEYIGEIISKNGGRYDKLILSI